MLLTVSFFLWWIPLLLATFVLLGFSVTASMSYAVAGLVLIPVGGLMALAGITIALVHRNRSHRLIPFTKRATRRRVAIVIALHLFNFPIAIAYAWAGISLSMPMTVMQSLSPDRAWVAETYRLDETSPTPYGQGVRVRPYWALVRKRASHTVFTAECRTGPFIAWKNERTLLIKCPEARLVTRRETSMAPDILISYGE